MRMMPELRIHAQRRESHMISHSPMKTHRNVWCVL